MRSFPFNKLYKWARGGLYILAALILVRTLFLGLYHIPTHSMYPSLVRGDRLAAPKWAYGYGPFSFGIFSLPPAWFGGQRIFSAPPKRGDIVVFTHPKTGLTLIKRVIGLPGDRISLNQERLYINGRLMPRRLISTFSAPVSAQSKMVQLRHYQERLENGVIYQTVEQGSSPKPRDTTSTVKVPQGHYFFLGDNRDASQDSRFSSLGMVPQSHLIGRADLILFSLHQCARQQTPVCKKGRWLTAP